ncbi:MAG: DUF6259 domain-containing protein [Opitutaceae bacterium]|jgi:hypothetical protein|nr:DUF6259 domain-containing protein [Opitutaceae bacterium]
MSTGTHPVLQNEHLRLELDPNGNLLALVNRHTGHNYAGGRPLWRLYLQDGPEFDIEITADSGHPPPEITVESKADTSRLRRLRLRHASLLHPRTGAKLAIELDIETTLPADSDEIHWTLHLANNQPGVHLRECHFPLVGALRPATGQQLIWTKNGGEKIPDLPGELHSRDALYKAPDHLFRGLTLNYPFPAASNCFTLSGPSESLYFGCHIAPPERTLHQFRLYPGDTVEAGFVRFPNLAHGQRLACGPFVISPCPGDWHAAARKYRRWADTWFHPQPAPRWVRRLNGWQRIILQHQYGEIHYNFDRLPEIRADGARSGIDTLFLFGWHRGGHDNNYPDYVPEPRLGTEQTMRDGIACFNRSGGHVILYANGRLMDRNSDYYRATGHRIAIRDFFGHEIREAYKFCGSGNFVSEFANRTVVPVCPSCPEWFDVLRDLADKASAWGCHSLFLDQAGTCEYPCADPAHPHPPLWTGLIQAKADTLRRLRDYLRSRDSEMALGIELLSDITAQHADYVHSLAGGCAAPAVREKTGGKPHIRAFPDWFRYTFPEVILTDREIRDDTDIERRVNHAVLKGLRSDIEIYRCRKTIAATPRYAAYLAKINALRQRHADLLLEGRYIDTDGFTQDNPEIEARAFSATDGSGRTAVVLTQSHLQSAPTRVSVPAESDLHFSGHDAAGEATVTAVTGKSIQITLSRHALVVALFNRG